MIEIFLSFQILVPNISSPLKPIDFIYEVLVPEVTIRLIRDDYDGNITLKVAKEIMIDSIAFGVYMNDD